MTTDYATKLLELKKKEAELKLEKQYTRRDIKFQHSITLLVAAASLLTGFIIGYLIK